MAVYKSFIKRALYHSLDEFLKKDEYLLKENVSERAITHKLAEYLQDEFGSFYNVDCEYNKNIAEPSSVKTIRGRGFYEDLKSTVRGRDITNMFESEYYEFSVYPDIIVHKRGKPNKNLLAIEVKKSNSRINKDYDYLKLKSYTDQSEANNLHYEFGVYINLDINVILPPTLVWFSNGKETMI